MKLKRLKKIKKIVRIILFWTALCTGFAYGNLFGILLYSTDAPGVLDVNKLISELTAVSSNMLRILVVVFIIYSLITVLVFHKIDSYDTDNSDTPPGNISEVENNDTEIKKILSETKGIWLSLLSGAVVMLITIGIFFAGNQLTKNIEEEEKIVECRVDKLYITEVNRLFWDYTEYYIILTDKAEKSYLFSINSEDYYLLEVGREISIKQKTTTLGEKIFSTAFYWGENLFELREEITDKVEQEETTKDTAITESTPENVSEVEE